MSGTQSAAVLAVAALVLGSGFQILLAAGLPLGRAAWGGRYGVLPRRLRWASLAAVVPLGVAAWTVLARADLLPPGGEPLAIRVAAWVFAAFFALNTLGNLASKSSIERYVMTPATSLLTACFTFVALSGP